MGATAASVGVISRYDAVTGVREDGIDLLACAMASGEGVLWAAGCPAVQRLSTDRGRLRKLVEVFLPFQSPGTVENSRVQFRELDVGAGSLWVLGDALDRRMWRLDRRTGRIQATIELGFAPTSVEVANGTVWITDGVRDGSCPSTRDNGCRRLRAAAVRPESPPAPGPCGANTLDGSLSRSIPTTVWRDRCGRRPPRRGRWGIGVGDRA